MLELSNDVEYIIVNGVNIIYDTSNGGYKIKNHIFKLKFS